MSRLRVPIALIVSTVLATALVACGDNGGGTEENPQAVMDAATLQGISSGVLDLSLAVAAKGDEGGDLDLSLSGSFEEAAAKDDLPQLDLTLAASGAVAGEEIDVDGGIVLLPNSAFVTYEGVDYEVDPTTYAFVEALISPPQRGANERRTFTACQEAVGELRPADLVDNLSNEGSADVDGTGTTKLSGDLDVSAALDSLIELREDPACRTQLDSVGSLPSKAELEADRDEVESAVKSARIDVYVGEDDIVRQISAELEIDPEERTGKGPDSADVEFELKLGEVNEEQEFVAPDSVEPLSELFLELGVNPLELLELAEGRGDPGELLERLGGAGE